MSSSSLTCQPTYRDTDKLKSLLRGKAADEDIGGALQRLDRLTQDELKDVAAQALGVVSGEQTPTASNPTSTEYPSLDSRRPERHQYVLLAVTSCFLV